MAAPQNVTDSLGVSEVAAWLERRPAPVLLDVRDPDEHAAGCLPGALLAPCDLLERYAARLVPDPETPIVTYCATGARSDRALLVLRGLGYSQVHSLRGGFVAWQTAGHRWVVPDRDSTPEVIRADLLSPEQNERYARHLRLNEVGLHGQQALLDASILCVGAGGLGSPACLYLAAAGIGRLGIVDDDVVELSNLQRQVLHANDRIGMPKVESAAQTLEAINPDARVIKHCTRLTADNAADILADYDVIIDGSDNFATRYAVNDAAIKLRKPVVHAAIQRFEGQLAVFGPGGRPCYRCLFPEPPPAGDAPSCAEAGVLGVLPGVLGVLQATEALKLILDIGSGSFGRLVIYDALSLRFRDLRFAANPACPACGH